MTARSLGIALATLALSASAALAGWGPDGATIKTTTNNIPKVSAINDGGPGTFVVWQEESASGSGVLRAQHVLTTGDVDPAWPADGALICNVATSRSVIGAVVDRLGGAYVWWKEGTSLYLSRFDATGVVASGWPARGRFVGTTTNNTIPAAIEDGAHGVYVVWIAVTQGQTDPTTVAAMHLGPSNTGAGGWPNAVRAVAAADPVMTLDHWPHAALASDGGLFVAWASGSSDEGAVTSGYRLRRLTTAGVNASGWDPAGVVLGDFHGDWFSIDPKMSLIGLTEDGLGGVFAMLGLQTSYDGTHVSLETRVFRLQETGAPRVGWPLAGTVITDAPAVYSDVGADASYQLLRGDGFAQVGFPTYYDHATLFGLAPTTTSGGWTPFTGTGGSVDGHEVVHGPTGNVFFADFYPHGALGPYEPNAYLRVTQSNPSAGWSDFIEHHDEVATSWYGDIGLAESGDGGAVLFWSQVHDRFGLFARRFNGAAEVTGLSPPIRVRALDIETLRFVAGEGVRASVAIPAGESATLDLFDVTGRHVATSAVTAADDARPLTIDGTRALASGLYFARLANGRASASAKVVVAR